MTTEDDLFDALADLMYAAQEYIDAREAPVTRDSSDITRCRQSKAALVMCIEVANHTVSKYKVSPRAARRLTKDAAQLRSSSAAHDSALEQESGAGMPSPAGMSGPVRIQHGKDVV